jgi:Lrp/AsnC family leucine-responsive transcriptional regulator
VDAVAPAANVRSVPPALEDETDLRIVTALQSDGRATLRSLADATGLSVSAVQARVRRLEAEGAIRGYRADLDPDALGLPLAAIIAVTPLDPASEYDIPDRLAALSQVQSCHSVAGEASFMLFVRVASPRDLEALIREIRRRANVSTRTTVVLQTFFDRPATPPE